MKYLYAPWRSEYTQDIHKTKQENTTEKDCVFCIMLAENEDKKNQILRRFKHTFVMMNHFPYNAGHLLIIPFAHIPTLDQLSKEARAEIMELAYLSCNVLQKHLDAQGFNIGINIGKASGAGIPSHLHQHVLPRFFGDTNFLPALAETKQISFDLEKIYKKLKPSFEQMNL